MMSLVPKNDQASLAFVKVQLVAILVPLTI